VSGESSFPNFFTKAPVVIFFLKKFVQRVAYEKIKLKDGKDVEIYENLDFVNCDWHNPDDLTTPKGLLKSLLVGD